MKKREKVTRESLSVEDQKKLIRYGAAHGYAAGMFGAGLFSEKDIERIYRRFSGEKESQGIKP